MSSEIDAAPATENNQSLDSSERGRSGDSTAQTVADLGSEAVEASANQGSGSSESASENSDSAASTFAEDDGSSGSAFGDPSPAEPDHSDSQEATELCGVEENVHDSDNDNDSVDGFFAFDLRKMLIQYGKEILCFFALALTTYATLQNGPPKVSRAPPPTPLFSKHSVVQEWPTGHLNVIQSQVSMSELSLVLFYAPWCAESQFAKAAYEGVAYKYHKEVYFAAVNCWQPGGECRLQYAKVHTWPVLMAYFSQGIAVQYNGPWLMQPLTRFIENLMKPYKRISNMEELELLRADSNSVAVGFFDGAELKQTDFFLFVQSAIKWLEKDPYQDVQFAIVTGESCRNFNVVETPALRLYNWNETLDMKLSTRWTVDNMTRWIKDHLNFITTWIHPPGKKSATLAPYLKTGPTILFFTPKDYYSLNKDSYHLLKQVALEYQRCKNDSKLSSITATTIHTLREENLKSYLNLKLMCSNVTRSKRDEEDTDTFKGCSIDEPNITFSNMLNSSKFDRIIENAGRYCFAGPRTKGYEPTSSCRNVHSREWRESFSARSDSNARMSKSPLSMLSPERDSRSAIKLREKYLQKQCDALQTSDNEFGSFFFKNDARLDRAELAEKVSALNRTFSFILLDSIMYKPFAARLGIDIETNPKKSSIIIIDNDNDSAYHMKGEISTNSVLNFTKNFLSGAIKRKLRSTKRTSAPSTDKRITIKEVDSKEFRNYLNASRRPIVVLFYSVQCALCTLMSQTILTVSRILQTIDIDFLRIDSDINDFQWHYTMDTYPTLIIFPRNRTSDSRVFPHSMEVNVSNILGFIIANLNPEERLQAIYESCQFRKTSSSIRNCLYTMRTEISDGISWNLHLWRHYSKRRNEVIRKLQVLQRIYLQSFQIDSIKDFELIRRDLLQLYRRMEK